MNYIGFKGIKISDVFAKQAFLISATK